MKKKVILLCTLLLFLPDVAFAGFGPGETIPIEEGVFGVSSTSSGTYPLRTPGGSTVYTPAELGGKNFIGLTIRHEGQSSGKIIVTLADGHQYTEQMTVNGLVKVGQRDFDPHPSKSVKVTLINTGNKPHRAWVAGVAYGNSDNGGTIPGGGDPGGSDGGKLALQWNAGTRRITWDSFPSGTYEILVTDPSGKKVRVTPGTKVFKAGDDGGVYKFQALDMNGKVLASNSLTVPAAEPDPGGGDPPDPGGGDPPDPGGGDPPDPGGGDPPDPGGGTGGCGSACDRIKDALECPGFDEYLGKWADMIRGTYPPPPDWHYVADVMRDSVVPAMGAEIVNRAPEIADIIADEFESREKKVSPPPRIDPFRPDLPRFQDVQEARDDLNRDVPGFYPDYSEDKGFVIPDPANIKFEDTSDRGYNYNPAPVDRPDYQQDGPDPSDGDIGYETSEQTPGPPPDYQSGPEQPGQAPGYETPPEAPQPGYEGSEGDGGNQDYQHRDDPYREYEGR